MIATRQIDFRANLKKYFDFAYNGSPVFVTRKKNENVVVVSEQDFNEYQRLKANAEYMEKIERSYTQLQNGETVTMSMEQLQALENEN